MYAGIPPSHLEPLLGGTTLDRLRPFDVEALIVRKRQAGLSPSTIRTIYTVLRATLDVAVRDGLVHRNVAIAVKRPTVERTYATYLSVEQAQQLLVALRDRLEPLSGVHQSGVR
jgi:site-specific recombinase XerC